MADNACKTSALYMAEQCDEWYTVRIDILPRLLLVNNALNSDKRKQRFCYALSVCAVTNNHHYKLRRHSNTLAISQLPNKFHGHFATPLEYVISLIR